MDQQLVLISDLLKGMEAELAAIGLWESEPPPELSFTSRQPFCFDTLMFHQWLQWLFIPRMKNLIEAGGETLPQRSAILPYAADCLRDHEPDARALLSMIGTVDELITGTGDERRH